MEQQPQLNEHNKQESVSYTHLIPQHAFDYLQMPAFTRCTAQELLTGREEVISFNPNTPTAIDVPAYGGKLLKIKF